MEKGQVLIKGPEEEILKKIKKVRVRNKKVIKVVEEIKKAEVKVLRNDK